MQAGAAAKVSDGRGGLVASDAFTHLAAGTMVTSNLARARTLYEDVLGFECVVYAPGRMLLRDRRAKYLMENGERDFFVIDVTEMPSIDNPQKTLNHWGISVGTPEEVNRLHAVLKEKGEALSIRKVRPVTQLHGSHGFYFVDVDDNWWEIEYRNGMTNDGFFSNGDHDSPTTDDAMKIDPPLPIAATPSAILGPEAFMTHGTTDVVDVAASRRFYEKVLGLRSVQHVSMAQFVAGGGDFAFVGVQAGKQTAHQDSINRWVLLVDEERMQTIRDAAFAAQDEFQIKEIGDCQPVEGGGTSFLLCTADDNWFEISTRSPRYYLDKFAAAND
jgi:catechol 2,3-dioxygenase-like lactoylglutathione lyase family enzyme